MRQGFSVPQGFVITRDAYRLLPAKDVHHLRFEKLEAITDDGGALPPSSGSVTGRWCRPGRPSAAGTVLPAGADE